MGEPVRTAVRPCVKLYICGRLPCDLVAYKSVPDPKDQLFFANRSLWRSWLARNHEVRDSIWLIFHKKDSPTKSVDYESAVLEALCFGWIDSKAQRIDQHTYRQYFSKRKPTGNWNGLNKRRIAQLRKGGLMTPAGEAAIALAQANGAWNFLDDVEAMVIPDDLAAELDRHGGGVVNFEALPKTKKQGILVWIKQAKRDKTRADRITKTAEAVSRGETPLSYL